MASTNKLRDDEGVFWKIFRDAEKELKGSPARILKSFVRSTVLKRFAEEYRISVSKINPRDNNSIYVAVSYVMTLLRPKSDQAKQNLHRELEKGGLPFLCAVQIARGKINSHEDYVQPRAIVIKKTAIELAALLDSVCDLASKHGYSTKEIANALELAKQRAVTQASLASASTPR